MNFKNKYQDEEEVVIKETGRIVKVKTWSYIPRFNQYAYELYEHNGTFYWEYELDQITLH
ncbi:hypothetical protein M5X17_27740 [Paenibacillus alvei]|uniref:hypothetical protein n=1 Tax=Paenibacillus alvei TaxID=44250 RepID=UPI00228006E4|nr:hypothetical protein [Paenibacillus alvei]MCY9737499.1 hypothetical protein [Paenibacillus alvei]